MGRKKLLKVIKYLKSDIMLSHHHYPRVSVFAGPYPN